MWKEKAIIFLSGAAAVPLMWIAASVINVWMHNCTDFSYAWWNFFTMFR